MKRQLLHRLPSDVPSRFMGMYSSELRCFSTSDASSPRTTTISKQCTANLQGSGDMGTHWSGVERGECSTMRCCQVLQGSGAVCAPLQERDLELNRDHAGTAGRVPYLRRIPDGAETQTPQRFVWELDTPLDEGRARGMWSSLHEGVHQYTPCYDCDVCA